MTSNTQQRSDSAPMMTPGFLPPPVFFGPQSMDINMHGGWHGATLHNGFLPRFRADGSTVMSLVPENLTERHKGDGAEPSSTPTGASQSGQSPERVEGEPTTPGQPDDVISISSYEDDGAKPCHVPGDSTYRGRLPRSRIKDAQPDGEGRVTRSKLKSTNAKAGANRRRTKQQTATEESNIAHDADDEREANANAKRPRRSRRTVKSKPLVMSSDDDKADNPQESEETPVDPPLTQPRPTLEPSPLPLLRLRATRTYRCQQSFWSFGVLEFWIEVLVLESSSRGLSLSQTERIELRAIEVLRERFSITG
ncbi:hypothetical protein CC2G_005546 [Coprinopsis cinerea AmutBmut pab1-1]|nr:hypothetical protein CC2G_005546 [Coprinopsis cinerea AmutBmut pab1-1]